MPEFKGIHETTLLRKLKAVESLIRSYTNNNFQNRLIRFSTASSENELLGACDYLRVGDTVQISESINDGLYTVKSIGTFTTLDEPLFASPHNLVTKVEYPDAIIDGTVNIMLWELSNRSKVGIKSESLSRHSVTYFEQGANEQLLGYPTSLVGFLAPYIKARF